MYVDILVGTNFTEWMYTVVTICVHLSLVMKQSNEM